MSTPQPNGSGHDPERTASVADHAATSRPAHREPDHIGPFRILQKVGEGGMGIVYKAEQREPVRRIVALKVIRLGMDTREVVARFEAERQALALLSHPNVARVFEAGMTDNGRPFFAMEYVAGVPLTVYCDESHLTTRQRIELFIPVCQAVQHAHQKGIIHRDLKPTNILVMLVDGRPVPKVIDFGIAKATNQALTQHTLFTQTGTLIGTPEYMSPEQAMTSGLDVDTRTDIYSLGVILYELLTGALPIDTKALRAASIEGMARLIKTVEPPRPSTRLTLMADRVPAEGSAGRQSRALQKELRGDLDWIILKAMEKERSRRYESASALALELQRHLDHEPVLARPPSAVYRMRKFVRKHRVGVAAASLVAGTLVAGVATSTSLYLKSLANEKKAASALAELRSTAPTYIAQARALFAEQKPSEAIAAIEFALRLDPSNPDYNLLLAHKRQALGQLPQAIEAYQRVLALRPGDAAARLNLELSEKLEKTRLSSGQLPSASNIELLAALTAQQRVDDLWPLQRTVGRDAMANRQLILSRTRNLQSLPDWTPERVVELNDGTFLINLNNMGVSDLSWVAGLPISELYLYSTSVTDIGPLAGLPLRTLNLGRTNIRDISPLRGMKLTDLTIGQASLSDLTPLVGTPLERLVLVMCGEVEHLEPLAGLPLKELQILQCHKITDFSPLARCPQLERLVLPTRFQDIALLRRIPHLKKVLLDDSMADFSWDFVPPIEQFLPGMEKRLAEDAARLKQFRADLEALGMPREHADAIRFLADGAMSLDLRNYSVPDLAILKGLRIHELFLLAPNNQFSDLSPLAGMPLWNIGIHGGNITDLGPLRGCPLNIVRIEDCPLKDIGPLKGMKLGHLSLENTAVEDLRPLAGCSALRLLYLSGTQVSDLSPLADCKSLQELTANRCPITDLSPLANAPVLRLLQLENTRIQSLAPIARAKLRELNVGGTKVGDLAPLAGMATLEYLLARGTPVRDLSPLSRCASLSYLDVENSLVEDLRPISHLKIRILKIGGTPITDAAPLKQMTELEDLSATGLPIRDLSILANCSKLRMLYLGNIPATDISPICKLPLNTLYIDGSQIADVSPLAHCKTLENLLIPRGAKGVEALRNHPGLKRLSYTWDEKAFRVSQTTQEFWASFDAGHSRQAP